MFHNLLFPISFSPEATFSPFFCCLFHFWSLFLLKRAQDGFKRLDLISVAERINVQDKNNFKNQFKNGPKALSRK